MFLGLPDLDAALAPDPSFSHKCVERIEKNACKIKFKHKMLAKKFIFKAEDNVKSYKKTKESDPEPDPLVRGMDPGIRIRTKMSRIPQHWFKQRHTTFTPKTSRLFSF